MSQTEQVTDHKGEALSALTAARQVNPNDPEYPILLAEADVHSNLAIAAKLRRIREDGLSVTTLDGGTLV